MSDKTDLQRLKLSTPAAVDFQVAATSTRAVVANPNRVSLILPSSPTQTLTWRFGSDVAAGRGITLTANAPAHVIELALDGGLVFGPWFVIGSIGAETLTYHEATLERP